MCYPMKKFTSQGEVEFTSQGEVEEISVRKSIKQWQVLGNACCILIQLLTYCQSDKYQNRFLKFCFKVRRKMGSRGTA